MKKKIIQFKTFFGKKSEYFTFKKCEEEEKVDVVAQTAQMTREAKDVEKKKNTANHKKDMAVMAIHKVDVEVLVAVQEDEEKEEDAVFGEDDANSSSTRFKASIISSSIHSKRPVGHSKANKTSNKASYRSTNSSQNN